MSRPVLLCLSSFAIRAVAAAAGASSLYVTSFARYPGYAGDLHVAGDVAITPAGGLGKWELTWSLTGVDTACTAGAADGVANGCGIHIHDGTSCEAAALVGGHHYNAVLNADPWLPLVYVAAADGSSENTLGVQAEAGLSRGDVQGRVVVVHALASGARVACGVIQDLACAGFGPPQMNTDIAGHLIAKVWAPSADSCCALCNDQAECEGYVFHLDQCYLKKDLGAASSQEHAVARVKTPSNCEGYAPAMEDVDIGGILLSKIWSSTSARCCALCDAITECEGYVFHLDQCYLKKELGSPTPKPNAITRLRYHV